MKDRVTFKVPASTSNCGAGFDTLGLALSLHNKVSVNLQPGSACEPERPADSLASEMVKASAAAFFAAAALAPSGFRYRIEGDVPAARGLGSSVTVVAGVLAGLNVLHGAGLSAERLIGLATAIEGHPDNASAGILGGFCVSRTDPENGAYLGTIRFAVPSELSFVVASPDLQQLTKESRGALPSSLPYFDAVRSINSASYLVAAFASGDFSRLKDAVADFMHEPYRLPRIPGGRAAIEAGIGSGALTGWLSGSGSSVLCVCERPRAKKVLESMSTAFSAASMSCQGRILSADNRGIEQE